MRAAGFLAQGAGPGWLERRVAAPAALAGLYILALLGSFSPAGANAGMALILLATIIALPAFWRDVRREPVFWLALVFSAYVLVRSLFAVQAMPELADSKNPHWSHVLRMTGLLALPLGWWLYRNPRHFVPVLVVALAGLLVGIGYEARWDRVLAGRFGWRHVWGYPPNYLGMVSGMAMLGLLAWLLAPMRKAVIRPAWLLGLPLLAAMSLLLYTSQSRAAWLALPVGLGALAAGLLLQRGVSVRRGLVVALSFVVILLSLGAAAYWFDGGGIILSRMQREWETIMLIAGGELGAAAEVGRSVGVRIEIWLAGLAAAGEALWFGWGPGAAVVLLRGEFADLPHAHFHNLYLELLVGLGLIGLALAAAVAWCFVRAAWRAGRAGLWPSAVTVGLLAITAFVAVMLLFEIRIGQTEGRATLTLLTAVYALAVFRVAQARREAAETASG